MYKLYFADVKINGKDVPDFHFTVLPEKLKESGGKENEIYNTLGIGEVVKPGPRKLKTWEISSVYEGEGSLTVAGFKQYIEDIADYGEYFSFIVNREMNDGGMIYNTDVSVVLEDYSFEDREGEPGVTYFTLKLREYRTFEAKKIL